MMNIDLDLGIITGEQKLVLERYIDSRLFRQRKNYDEYYVDSRVEEFKGNINDLCILAGEFDVCVYAGGLILKSVL
jgi:hypothetical protein